MDRDLCNKFDLEQATRESARSTMNRKIAQVCSFLYFSITNKITIDFIYYP